DAIPPAPTQDAPLHERLGKRGASFTLSELIEGQLLSPLQKFDWRKVQNQLSLYTVVRFGAEADFEKEQVRDQLAPLLSGLAQIEEPTHAGARAGTVSVTNAILNRRHWAGVGILGAAHIVADQPQSDLPFNAERVSRVMQKYFISYLVALLQRTSLHRTIDEATRFVLSPGKDGITGLIQLREHLLEFAVDGYFIETSSREAIHRYYRMTQEGLDVRNAFDDVRQAILDIEARQAIKDARGAADQQIALAENMAGNIEATKRMTENQVLLAKGMNAHLGIVSSIQRKIEWVEVLLVSVYLAHLGEMIVSHIRGVEWVEQTAWLIVAGCAAVGFVGTALYLQPWHHKAPQPISLKE
ncbi:MAG: hypothetical protein JOZ52_04340, partial [Acidobacteria bacterium]|nr:hypothetical protein [Acidobacteriota bacterium]